MSCILRWGLFKICHDGMLEDKNSLDASLVKLGLSGTYIITEFYEFRLFLMKFCFEVEFGLHKIYSDERM